MSHSHSLRRRFEQNQEDCTFTVLALLPTATTNILNTMNTEQITYEIQQAKTAKTVKTGPTAAATSDSSPAPPSIADTTLTEEDGKSSASMLSDSGVHASQISVPPTSDPGSQDGGASKSRRTKRQLWDDLIISCMLHQTLTSSHLLY
jgi:peroxin-3